MTGQGLRRPENLASVRHLCAAVSHMEVDDILSISPLHGNSKRFKGVKGEGNKPAHCVVDGAAQ